MVTYVPDKDSKNFFSKIIGPYRKLMYALIILLCVALLFLYSSLLPAVIALTGRFEGQLKYLSGGISIYWPYWLTMFLPIFYCSVSIMFDVAWMKSILFILNVCFKYNLVSDDWY